MSEPLKHVTLSVHDGKDQKTNTHFLCSSNACCPLSTLVCGYRGNQSQILFLPHAPQFSFPDLQLHCLQSILFFLQKHLESEDFLGHYLLLLLVSQFWDTRCTGDKCRTERSPFPEHPKQAEHCTLTLCRKVNSN